MTTNSGTVGGPECTLRDAITAADSDLPTGGCPAGSGADTIVLAPGVTYLLDIVDNTTVENGSEQPNGLPSITSVITIAGNDTTIARPSIGETPAFRFLHVAPGAVLTLSGLTLTGALAPANLNMEGTMFSGGNGGAIFNEGTLVLTQTHVIANEAAASGGAIYNSAQATVNLTDSSVSGNQSDECATTLGDCPGIGGGGGAITNDGFMTASSTVLDGNYGADAGAIRNTGSISLDHCTVNTNEATFDAGGLDNAGSATVTDSTFSGNFTDGFDSGAIRNEASATLRMTNCVLTDNMASDDGAISNYGTATLTNCTLSNNVANSGGGCCGAIGNSGTIKLTGCTIIGNFAFDAAGIGNGASGTMDLANCTLTGNTVGGGVGNLGSLTMTNCTISGNMSSDGGAGINHDDSFGGTATINNCIISDNSSMIGPGNCSGPMLGTGHNLSTDETCRSSPELIVADAGVAPLGNYGGPTETMALCTTAGMPDPSCTGPSPAIDAGDPGLCAMPPVDGRDQRGFARPGMGHMRCALGAFEADAVPALTCIGDCGGTASVAITNLVTLVNIALGSALPTACPYGIPSGTNVSIALLIQAVNNALSGCPLG